MSPIWPTELRLLTGFVILTRATRMDPHVKIRSAYHSEAPEIEPSLDGVCFAKSLLYYVLSWVVLFVCFLSFFSHGIVILIAIYEIEYISFVSFTTLFNLVFYWRNTCLGQKSKVSKILRTCKVTILVSKSLCIMISQ